MKILEVFVFKNLYQKIMKIRKKTCSYHYSLHKNYSCSDKYLSLHHLVSFIWSDLVWASLWGIGYLMPGPFFSKLYWIPIPILCLEISILSGYRIMIIKRRKKTLILDAILLPYTEMNSLIRPKNNLFEWLTKTYNFIRLFCMFRNAKFKHFFDKFE